MQSKAVLLVLALTALSAFAAPTPQGLTPVQIELPPGAIGEVGIPVRNQNTATNSGQDLNLIAAFALTASFALATPLPQKIKSNHVYVFAGKPVDPADPALPPPVWPVLPPPKGIIGGDVPPIQL
ncbi:hypothetical protein BDR26DRAFT_930002 [Obelidium mucronatum]|nr:hypothetical protein BDR26DRAFT_930002 [Obelidium mucronatum]